MVEKISPEYFNVPSIGEAAQGFISIAEFPGNVPFEIRRVYWTYYTPQNVTRGGHAHKALYQLIFAVSGTITFYTEDRKGEKKEFILSEPNNGIYLPPYVWREIKFSTNSVLLCLASAEYNEDDYIREYNRFKNIISA